MKNQRRNFAKGNQHKCAFGQPWVWNLQSGLTDRQSIEQQDVEVECSRAVLKARLAVPAKLLLDPEKPVKQLARRQVGLQFNHRIHKTWLLSEPHRHSGIERRPASKPPQRLKPPRRCCQRSLRRPRPTGQVAAHPNVCRPHPVQSIATTPARVEGPTDSHPFRKIGKDGKPFGKPKAVPRLLCPIPPCPILASFFCRKGGRPPPLGTASLVLL